MSDTFAVKVLEEVPTDFGYVVRREIWPAWSCGVDIASGADQDTKNLVSALDGDHGQIEMETCYTIRGDWIGDIKVAKFLCQEKGIAPEHKETQPKGVLRPCSIGFCAKDQKWYGWSHRAIYGFGVGSSVKIGDLAYKPRDEAGFRRKYLQFFGVNKYHKNERVVDSVSADGDRGALITATYTDDVPNEKLRGTEYRIFWPYKNDKMGRGEWVAETLEDARQMAIDFADGVS